MDPRQRGVRLRHGVVELQRLHGCGARFWQWLERQPVAVAFEREIGIRQSNVRQSELRIAIDRLLEKLRRFVERLRCETIPGVLPFQVELIGLRIVGAAPRDPGLLLSRFQSSPNDANDVGCDPLLKGGSIVGLAVVPRSPYLRAVGGANQLRLDIDSVATLDDVPRQNRTHAQLFPDFLWNDRRVLVLEGRAPGHHAKCRYL